MERYIQQLIEDLREAARKTPEPGELWSSVNWDDPGEVEDMAHVEQFLYGTPQKLSEIVGIEKVQLPPIEKLTDKDPREFQHPGDLVVVLYNEMELLLKAHHFVPDFPEGVPAAIKYALLREKWDSDQVLVGAGEVHIEFCDYYPETCPFPQEYCDCRNLEEEDELPDDELGEGNGEHLPFRSFDS